MRGEMDALDDLLEVIAEASDGAEQISTDAALRAVRLLRDGTSGGVRFDALRSLVAARGDAPVRPAEPRPVAIDGAWLVEEWDECTCAGGGEWPHEPGCGTVPLVDLSTLPGWSSVRSVSAAQVRIIASESGRSESVVRDWLRVAGIEVAP